MSTELKAGDTITAESLNGIAEGAYTFKSGEILTASKLNTIAEAIEDKDEEIADLEGQVEELQAIIDAFPTIESLNVTQNGIYQEAGKAYTPVDVNVSSVAVEALNVTANGTYNEDGKAYSPVNVNVPESFKALRNFAIAFTNNDHVAIYRCTGDILGNALTSVAVERSTGAGALGGFFATKDPSANRDITILCEGSCTATVTYGDLAIINTYEDSGFTVVKVRIDSNYTIPDYSTNIGGIKIELNTQP